MCLLASSFDSPFQEHGAIQANRSEWANLVGEAQQNGQQWLKDQLALRNVKTLLQFSVSAELRLGRHPPKHTCIAALVENAFPVEARFSA